MPVPEKVRLVKGVEAPIRCISIEPLPFAIVSAYPPSISPSVMSPLAVLVI